MARIPERCSDRCADLVSSLFDFDAPADRYAVMGNPVAHSKSPMIHAEFARQTGQRLLYDAVQVDPGGFAQAVGNFQATGGKGLNVTVPFKREAWELVDERSPRADTAGAVNTISFDAQGRRLGDNTDGIGMVRDIVDNLGGCIRGRRVLLLGAGGAVRGVLAPLLDEGPAAVTVANRTVERAVALVETFNGIVPLDARGFADLAGSRFDIIVNGTAASLHGEALPLPSSVAAGSWCYDMMYAAEPTAFMRWALAHGAARVDDGLGMLVEQAAEAFFIWRGVRPHTPPVIAMVRGRLGGFDA